MAKVEKKRIYIHHKGPIYSKGNVYGPILTPYIETTENIFNMLKDKVRVIEILDNNSEVVIDTQNFDEDLNVVEEEVIEIPIPDDDKKTPDPEPNVSPDATEDAVLETKTDAGDVKTPEPEVKQQETASAEKNKSSGSGRNRNFKPENVESK